MWSRLFCIGVRYAACKTTSWDIVRNAIVIAMCRVMLVDGRRVEILCEALDWLLKANNVC